MIAYHKSASRSSFQEKRFFQQKYLAIFLPVFLFILLAGWAVSSPPGSSPDDDYHLTSIWCAEGSQENRCLFLNDKEVAVPKNIGAIQECYAFRTNKSAECVNEIEEKTLFVTSRENSIQKLYPTLYYKTFHVLTILDSQNAIALIRLINAALASLILFSVLKLSPIGVQVPFVIAYSLGIVPLGLFIIPSTNPSSWAVLGISAFWAYATTLLWRKNSLKDPKTVVLCVLVLASSILAIGSRPDSMIYVSVATIMVALYVGFTKIKKNIYALLYLIVLSILGLYFFMNTSTPGGNEVMGIHEQNAQLFFSNLFQVVSLYEGILGGWALGWNDTPLYSIIPFIGLILLGGIVYVSFTSVSRNKFLSLLFIFLVSLAVPLLFLQVEGLRVGEVVQPRYLLPLFLLFIMSLAAGKNPDSHISMNKGYLIFYVSSLIFTSFLSFAVNLNRYAFGGAPGFPIAQGDSLWNPIIFTTPFLLAYVACCSLLFFGLIGVFLKKTKKSELI